VNITKHFDSLATKNLVLLGNSFIALETASFFTGKASTITVLCRDEPFKMQLGEKVAQVIKALHESKGVRFLVDRNMSVAEFKAYEEPQFNRKLASVRLSNGTDLPADIFIAAIGSRPVTDFLKGSGLVLNEQGFVLVDKFMRTNIENVYAVGDITSFPRTCVDHNSAPDELISIAHWQMASAQGRCAARSIVSAHEELRSVPFFWSVNQGKSVRFAGINRNYDEILFFGDPAGENATKFIAYYVLQGRVVAVCSCDWDPVCAQFAELQFARVPVRKMQIKDDPASIKNLLAK
jgi:NADPH-dependent 2,4-dienoyl-CoA reductase/sulfur reductase-like enzyme